ncbi:MAG: hypothetical protein JNJ99_14575, partial [Crocinitomicaceae bacterium]|nr:hypothetical protein [Crocinitomicaceae bacterium]
MKVLLFCITVIALLSFRYDRSVYSDSVNHPTIDTTKLVARHNYYRQQVGAPDIHW